MSQYSTIRLMQMNKQLQVVWRFVLIYSFCLIFSITATAVSWAQESEISTDQRLLDGLRQRKLFQLAELHCRQELKQKNSFQRQASLNAQWIFTLSQHALNVERNRRDLVWKEAETLLANFKKQYPDHPHLLLVQFQAAKAELDRGQQLRQEAELLTNAKQLLIAARRQLAVASFKFTSLEQKIDIEKQRIARSDDKRLLSSRQLLALESNIQFQVANTYRNMAQCYPSKSNDQIDALTQSLKRLDQLMKMSTVSELYWAIRLERINCFRLQKKFSVAEQSIKKLVIEQPPQNILTKIKIESAKIALDQKKYQPALLILKQRPASQRLLGYWDYVHLKSLLVAWKQAIAQRQEKQIELWKKQVIDKVQQIEIDHPGYWARRSELAIAGSINADSGASASTTMLSIAAKNYYLANKYPEAIASYRRAAKLAKTGSKAFGWFLKAASIQQQHGELTLAIDEYIAVSSTYHKQPQAASVHLHAILLIKKNQKSLTEKQFETQLKQHLKLWPNKTTANTVRQLLGDLMIEKQKWTAAITAFQSVSKKYKHLAYVQRRIAFCFQQYCAELTKNNKPVEQFARNGADWIEKTIAGKSQQWPKTWNQSQRWMILTAAEIRLKYTTDGYLKVEQALTAAINASPKAEKNWKQAANSFLIQALVGQKKRKRATDLLKKLSGGNPAQLLSVATGLSKIANQSKPEVMKEIAELQLEMVVLIQLQSTQLSKQQKISLACLKGRCLATAGKHRDAVLELAKLAKQNPKNASIQQQYAQLLSEGKTRASWSAALQQWRYLEKHQRRGTAAWFRAKYAIAQLHQKLGNHQQVKKIIILLSSLYPEMGGPEMKAKFENLIRSKK